MSIKITKGKTKGVLRQLADETAARKSAKGQEVKIELSPSEEILTFYANYAEISSTFHDFTVYFAKVPSKVSRERREQIAADGRVEIEPIVQVVIPTTLLPSILRAFTLQLETYEAVHGKISDGKGGM